ncbi:MAG: AMP-binding protein [Burkholderiaceae bacterium]|nr:AMP-binding protein [Burkholderiaceae bacterium]
MPKLPNPEIAYWPADQSRPLLDMAAGEALRQTADRMPDRCALVEVVPEGFKSLTGASRTDRRWTYAELLAHSEQCARWLLHRFQSGDHVCLWAPNVPEWVILQYGAALAGMVLVTANPALRADELRYVLKQSRSVALIYVDEFRGTDMVATAQAVANEVQVTFSLSQWGEVRGFRDTRELPVVSSRAPAQLQYTSGTTGQPKGALLHHMGLLTNSSYVTARLELDGGVLVSPMPLFHTAGSVMSVLGSMTSGATLVLPQFFDVDAVLAAIEREKGTVLYGVPTMLIAMVEHPRRTQYNLSSLRYANSGGAPVPPELLKRVQVGLGCDLLSVYGQTEASPIICQTAPQDALADKAETAGQPLWQVEVRIADPLDGTVQAVGVGGEVQARGYQTMLGYYDMPEATAQALTSEGWLRTGDLGVMDDRGYVRITGRLKDMIIRGGENIFPVEVEARLLQHPAVVDVAVFGLLDPHWGEIVCAALRFRSAEATPTAEELRQFCKQSLAPQKAPTKYFASTAFPLTGSGKIQKFRLIQQAREGALTLLT